MTPPESHEAVAEHVISQWEILRLLLPREIRDAVTFEQMASGVYNASIGSRTSLPAVGLFILSPAATDEKKRMAIGCMSNKPIIDSSYRHDVYVAQTHAVKAAIARAVHTTLAERLGERPPATAFETPVVQWQWPDDAEVEAASDAYAPGLLASHLEEIRRGGAANVARIARQKTTETRLFYDRVFEEAKAEIACLYRASVHAAYMEAVHRVVQDQVAVERCDMEVVRSLASLATDMGNRFGVDAYEIDYDIPVNLYAVSRTIYTRIAVFSDASTQALYDFDCVASMGGIRLAFKRFVSAAASREAWLVVHDLASMPTAVTEEAAMATIVRERVEMGIQAAIQCLRRAWDEAAEDGGVRAAADAAYGAFQRRCMPRVITEHLDHLVRLMRSTERRALDDAYRCVADYSCVLTLMARVPTPLAQSMLRTSNGMQTADLAVERLWENVDWSDSREHMETRLLGCAPNLFEWTLMLIAVVFYETWTVMRPLLARMRAPQQTPPDEAH